MYERALEFATEKLKNLKNENGTPYIEHAIRVAQMMDTDFERTVAVLHDVTEDTEVKVYELSEAGFSREVAECIDQLTRRNSLTYFDYIDDISTNETAAKVKLAEVMDNKDIFRVKKLSFQTFSLEERCRKVIRLLLDANPDLNPWFETHFGTLKD
ncbi:MAG: HD domain-containing protein [Enterocloster sp.]